METLTFSISYEGTFDQHVRTEKGDFCYTQNASVTQDLIIELEKTNALTIKQALDDEINGLPSITPIKIFSVTYTEEDQFNFDIEVEVDNAVIRWLY